MNSINENDILFDDAAILIKLSENKDLIIISANNDCDCSSYKPLLNQNDCDPNQITSSISQTN